MESTLAVSGEENGLDMLVDEVDESRDVWNRNEGL
jgi:hypothetical protein